MYCNSYAPWSEEDIATLEQLYRNDIPLEQIGKVLDRSPRAIEHALKNVLVQSILHTNTRKTAMKYGVDMDTLYEDLVPSKYHIVSNTSDSAFLVIVAFIAIYVMVCTIGYYVGYT